MKGATPGLPQLEPRALLAAFFPLHHPKVLSNPDKGHHPTPCAFTLLPVITPSMLNRFASVMAHCNQKGIGFLTLILKIL